MFFKVIHRRCPPENELQKYNYFSYPPNVSTLPDC